MNEIFDVPLDIGFGEIFTVGGKTFIGGGTSDTTYRGLVTDKNSGKTVIIKEDVLPMTLYDNKEVRMMSRIKEWINDVRNKYLGSWVGHVYSNSHYPWVWHVMDAVQKYYERRNTLSLQEYSNAEQQSPEKKTLDQAIFLGIAITMLCRCMHITADAVQPLWREIYNCDPPDGKGAKLPRVLGRMFKSYVAFEAAGLSKVFFASLDGNLRARLKPNTPRSRRGDVLCILIILSVFVGMQQVALLDVCMLGNSQSDNLETKISSSVEAEMVGMEYRLLDVPVEYFQHKFKLKEWEKDEFRESKLDENTRTLVQDLLAIRVQVKGEQAHTSHGAVTGGENLLILLNMTNFTTRFYRRIAPD